MKTYGICAGVVPKTWTTSHVVEWFEGAILCIDVDPDGALYLEKWCDCDDDFSRYLLVKTDIETVRLYMDRKISMLDALTRVSDQAWIFDQPRPHLLEHEMKALTYVVKISDLPTSYLPSKDAMHDPELCPDADQIRNDPDLRGRAGVASSPPTPVPAPSSAFEMFPPPPPGWAIRIDDDKARAQYVLSLCADSAEEAEDLSLVEADRHIVDFVREALEWAKDNGDAEYDVARSKWSKERAEDPIIGASFPKKRIWILEQILAAATKQRRL